jgi:hypothetical protein
LIFLEVTIGDASDFETTLRVRGEKRCGYRILRVKSPSIPNAIAAILLGAAAGGAGAGTQSDGACRVAPAWLTSRFREQARTGMLAQ